MKIRAKQCVQMMSAVTKLRKLTLEKFLITAMLCVKEIKKGNSGINFRKCVMTA